MAQSRRPSNPFAVDPTDELPEGLQLGVRLRALISTGYLAAGEALPSVRQMEQLAGVNLSVVRVVYAHLEAHGLAVSRHGQGTFVADDVEATPDLEDLATAALQEALDAGLSPRAFADVVLACAILPDDSVPSRGDGADASAQEAEAIETARELRRQIARLDAELTSYPEAAALISSGQVDSIEELERVRGTRIEQLAEARLKAERRIQAEARERLLDQGGRPHRGSSGPLGRAMGRWRDEGLTRESAWLDSLGEIARFGGRVIGIVYSGRVLRFFGESLRQAGILILGSALVIWGLIFVLGLQCGIQGAYLLRADGAPSYAGVFSAWCDLREILPYAFGYMLSAKVGTGIVAELGAMRISDEIDALEVMGVEPVTYLCATRLLAAWIVLPFMFLVGIGVMYLASYIAVVQQIGDVSSGGYLLIFWQFQNPPDVLFSLIKGMVMATAIVLVGCYYGYTASGGPVGVGKATARSMVLNIVLVHIIGMLGTLVFWGANPRAPIGG